MNKLTIKRGNFRTGFSADGAVIAFRPSILDIEKRKREFMIERDIETQWSAHLDKQGHLVGVGLMIEWIGNIKEKLDIPFDLDPNDIKIMRLIAEKQRVFLVNSKDLNERFSKESPAVYADVTVNQQVEWIEWWEQGKDIRQWKEA